MHGNGNASPQCSNVMAIARDRLMRAGGADPSRPSLDMVTRTEEDTRVKLSRDQKEEQVRATKTSAEGDKEEDDDKEKAFL